MGGKQSVPVKTTVSDEVSEDLVKFSRERGYGSVSDCLRELLMTAMYGPDWLTDLHARRIHSLFQSRPTTGPTTGPATGALPEAKP